MPDRRDHLQLLRKPCHTMRTGHSFVEAIIVIVLTIIGDHLDQADARLREIHPDIFGQLGFGQQQGPPIHNFGSQIESS